MQANENENEKPFERVSPDQELQPTYSSSINIKTEGGTSAMTMQWSLVVQYWRMSDNQYGAALQFQACGFE